ncbi:hypothetical protein [Lishizhenia sp.]|uniref:hypothetical protein n=1 Tax=Lishizhenia sp. TaxID=2497594 RepID=UPI00299ED794|nr:hypothetical protein [Lishizhenia sp.]MDX1446547.1 hypothetical protein [Lishizhenia sp.]
MLKSFHISLLSLLCGLSLSAAGQTPGNVSSGTFEMWLKADQNSSVLNLSTSTASDGDEVSQWSDLSGNRTNDATNNNELSNPVYSADSSTVLNYNPTLTFDGISSGLNFGNDYIYPDAYEVLGIEFGAVSFEGLNFFIIQKPSSTNFNKCNQFIYDVGNYKTDGMGFTYNQSTFQLYTPPGLLITVGDILNGILDPLLSPLSSFVNVSIGSESSDTINHVHLHETTLSRNTVISGSDLLGSIINSGDKSVYLNGEMSYNESSYDLIKLNLNSILCSSSHSSSSGPFTIGRQAKSSNLTSDYNRAFEGQIAEVIGYSGVLSDAETNKIESYLAIKYGITLEHGGTENGNYTASDGTTVWSASTATTTYHNNIIGIARDDDSGLLQKQSHTQDDSLRVYLDELDTINAGNQGTFSNNLSFLLIGDNSDNLYSSSSYGEKPAGLYSRLDREWRIQSTNFTDTFNLDITLNNYAIINAIDTSDLYILVDNDGDFSSGANTYSSTDGITFILNGNVLSISGLNTSIFPNNSSNFFTIGSGSGNTPLPVQLTEFNVNNTINNHVQINWTTSTEINNDYYSLYHSTDAEHWVHLQKISGAGNSEITLHYDFLHETPKSGVNYYKLEQTDFDGTTKDLGIRSVQINPTTSQLQVFPNPVKGALHIRGEIDLSQGIYVINELGVAIRIDDYMIISDNHIVLNAAYLEKGNYYIKMNQQTMRFTKL